jgi:hypothetical protein
MPVPTMVWQGEFAASDILAGAADPGTTESNITESEHH